MSNGVSHQVVIGCQADDYPDHGQVCPAALEVEFGRVEADHVHVCTRLRIEGQAFEGWRMHYGFDVLAFADGLARIHTEMRGSARLNDWDGEAVLCLTVIDRGRGRVAIGGQLIPAVFWTEAASEDGLLAPRLFGTAGGIRVAFEGLVTDQSHLPPVIAGLRRFLDETGISVRGPME
jgi:hypothetical protein